MRIVRVCGVVRDMVWLMKDGCVFKMMKIRNRMGKKNILFRLVMGGKKVLRIVKRVFKSEKLRE